jgi:hypothetical protein
VEESKGSLIQLVESVKEWQREIGFQGSPENPHEGGEWPQVWTFGMVVHFQWQDTNVAHSGQWMQL